MALHLTIEMGGGTVEKLTVAETGPITIGRDASCHVVLPSPDVSRRHLTIQKNDSSYSLTDASANGTMVGESHLHRTTCDAPGGLPLRVGPYIIRLDPLPGQIPVSPPRTAPPAARDVPPAPAHHAPPVAAPPQAPPRAPAPPKPPGSVAPILPSVEEAAPVQRPPASQEQEPSPYDVSSTADVTVGTRKRIHRMLLDNLDLASLDRKKMDDAEMRPKVRQALRRIMMEVGADLPKSTNTAQLIDEITNEALGLGPLEILLADDTVSEIMVVDPETIFVERFGRIQATALRFTDDEAVRAVIERIITPLGRRIDESTPLVDARLRDGSRVNAIIRPLAIKGSCITIRKFAKEPLTMDNLIEFGSLSAPMAKFIKRAVMARKNIIVSGGTGSGKTTLLNVLSAHIPDGERIVTVEDAAELQLLQPHVVSLESKPPNMEGKGAYTIRDLVKNALRMRPDRIIVGECRGGEALDMLQAMNTGHEGSMTTTHANSPIEACARIETLALMSGLNLPARAIREQIGASIDLIVQQTRFPDGSRRITDIAEVVGLDDDHEIELHSIFAFHRLALGEGGKVIGEFRASGYLPTFLDEFIAQGLIDDGDYL